MADEGSPTFEERLRAVQRQLRKRSLIFIVSLCLVVALQSGIIVIGLRRFNSFTAKVRNYEFSQDVDEYDNGTDFISDSVGVIQFLRHGYSITLDSAHYSQDGLTLTGKLGNPTQLWLSSLTLNFSVRPYASDLRKLWDKDGSFAFWDTSEFEIGEAQADVGYLPAGSTVAFSVTIPNVKQTSKSTQIAVWFSGERYSYMK